MAVVDLENRVVETFRDLAMREASVVRSAEAFKEDPTNYDSINAYVAAANIPEEKKRGMLEVLAQASPARVYRTMSKTSKKYGKNLAELTEQHYELIVNGLDEDELMAMFHGMSGLSSSIDGIRKALKKHDIGAVRKVLLSSTSYGDDDDWRDFIKNEANEQEVALLAKFYTETQAQYILRSEGLIEEKEVEQDGKKVRAYVPNFDKIKSYLLEAPGKIKKEDARKSAYISAGRSLFELYSMRAQEMARQRAA